MKVVVFINDYTAVDRIVDHLKLTFAAAKPPPAFGKKAKKLSKRSINPIFPSSVF
jgi:hypothetical protein